LIREGVVAVLVLVLHIFETEYATEAGNELGVQVVLVDTCLHGVWQLVEI
jgi:hypothetical protein